MLEPKFINIKYNIIVTETNLHLGNYFKNLLLRYHSLVNFIQFKSYSIRLFEKTFTFLEIVLRFLGIVWSEFFSGFILSNIMFNPLSPKIDLYVDLLICETSWACNHKNISRNLLFMTIYHLVLLKGR